MARMFYDIANHREDELKVGVLAAWPNAKFDVDRSSTDGSLWVVLDLPGAGNLFAVVAFLLPRFGIWKDEAEAKAAGWRSN